MSDSIEVNKNGIGFTGLLTVIFVIFKLTGNLAWSWWWVFAPIWISWAIAICFIGLGLLIAIVEAALS